MRDAVAPGFQVARVDRPLCMRRGCNGEKEQRDATLYHCIWSAKLENAGRFATGPKSDLLSKSARSSHLAGSTIHREVRSRGPSHPGLRKLGRRFPSPPDRQMHPCFRVAARSPVALRPPRRPFRQEMRAFFPTECATPRHQGSVLLVPRQLLSPLKTQLVRRPRPAAPFAQIRCKNICSTDVVGKPPSRPRVCFPLVAMLLDTSVPKGTHLSASQWS